MTRPDNTAVWRWAVGLIIGAIITVGGWSVAADRAHETKQDEKMEKLADAVSGLLVVTERVVAVQESNISRIEDAGRSIDATLTRVEGKVDSLDEKVDGLRARVTRLEAQQGR